jgi:hypothetical protein
MEFMKILKEEIYEEFRGPDYLKPSKKIDFDVSFYSDSQNNFPIVGFFYESLGAGAGTPSCPKYS